MNIIDAIVILFLITSVFRGYELGFVRQLFSTAGFFIGLGIGVFLERWTVTLVQGQESRSIVALVTTLGCAFLLLSMGEYVGVKLKTKLSIKKIDTADSILGSGIALISVSLAVWLSAAIASSTPLPDLQNSIKESKIISLLNSRLPAAPTVLANLGRIIDPNGFPKVFTGKEPIPPQNIDIPSLGELQPAVKAVAVSVVKIEGQGCGGIVEGSGFVVAKNLIVTNAHVVAGINSPYVIDSNGTHVASAIWFDPDLDLAVLRTSNLAGSPLRLNTVIVSAGTPAAVLGYPGGGEFSAKPAAVLDNFIASGRNIYGKGAVLREVYELHADVIQGNSGGPLVAKDGSVIGVIFAQSATYNQVGYALTAQGVSDDVRKAQAQNHRVSTGSCAD